MWTNMTNVDFFGMSTSILENYVSFRCCIQTSVHQRSQVRTTTTSRT